MKPVISVNGIGKEYQLGKNVNANDSFREMLQRAVMSPFRNFKRLSGSEASDLETFWAIKDISFDVQPGEAIGIIGRNGAGKSTLLKVLSRITMPTSGIIEYQGHLACLLEVGAGFHGELTGRENIFLNGSILGMSRYQVEEQLDDIVEFAEITKFLDTPVKRYSSGMYVRLAFSIAAHLNPDILIVDEVLAVGDQAFQQKCLGKLKSAAGDGRTIFFVSHNMAAVKNLCSRIIYLKDGQIEYDGTPEAAIGLYLSANKSMTPDWQDKDQQYNYLKEISIQNTSREKSNLFQYNEDIRVQIQLNNIDQIGLTTAVRVNDPFGNIIFTSWDSDSITASDEELVEKSSRSRLVVCTIAGSILKPASYILTVFVRYVDKLGKTRMEEVNLDLTISDENCVISSNRSGMIAPVLRWELLGH